MLTPSRRVLSIVGFGAMAVAFLAVKQVYGPDNTEAKTGSDVDYLGEIVWNA